MLLSGQFDQGSGYSKKDMETVQWDKVRRSPLVELTAGQSKIKSESSWLEEVFGIWD